MSGIVTILIIVVVAYIVYKYVLHGKIPGLGSIGSSSTSVDLNSGTIDVPDQNVHVNIPSLSGLSLPPGDGGGTDSTSISTSTSCQNGVCHTVSGRNTNMKCVNGVCTSSANFAIAYN